MLLPKLKSYLLILLYLLNNYNYLQRRRKTVKINNLKKFVRSVVESDQHIPMMIWSAPGIGKSSAIQQVAEELGYGFIDLRLSLLNPVDLRGLPYINKKTHKAEWLEPDFLPNGGSAEKGILFLDEINLAPQAVMAAGYQLILDRQLGKYKLPEGWKVIAAGNRAEDHAHVTKFPAPLANRFVHIELEHDIEEWQSWAVKTGIAEQIVAFLSKMPQHLFRMPKAGEQSFPTPRSWAQASKLYSLHHSISSAVGEGIEAEFMSFLSVYEELPDVERILRGEKEPVPDTKKVDVLYALSMSIVYRATPKHLANLFKYLDKLPKENQVLIIKSLVQKDEKFEMELLNSSTAAGKAWESWVNENKRLFNEAE